MNHIQQYMSYCFITLALLCNLGCREDFVKVKGTKFELSGKPYYFLGTNFWYGINLASSGAGGDRARLKRELDRLQEMGVTNLRIMAGSEGPDSEPYRMSPSMQPAPGVYNPDILEGLDYLLAEMAQRKMKAVMCLNNFWNWSGGMGQYIVWSGAAKSIPYPPPHPGGDWQTYQEFVAKFYTNAKAMELFENHLRFIINRTNSLTKIPYKEDDTIMSWELANEPRGINEVSAYLNWIDKTSQLIKSLAPKQLVTTGSEGETSSPSAGTSTSRDHQFKSIDYVTFHLWVQNWGVYRPEDSENTYGASIDYALNYIWKHEVAAKKIGKPLVLEEFGISRDKNDYNFDSSTKIRDLYYQRIFSRIFVRASKKKSIISGTNFWAWGGEGRAAHPGNLWMVGDDFIGDPAHEAQGWYSVYDTDASTINIIKKYSKKINGLNR
ncbi:MAG: cellulase family glycosylhydrolase [Bacteriovoracaceae bacterium]|nr:cellulase family glycosylhydrolase [Bacteriovoracaceae bacterium]